MTLRLKIKPVWRRAVNAKLGAPATQRCEVIESEATEDRLWKPFTSNLDKWTNILVGHTKPWTRHQVGRNSILYYNYCMMLWISRSERLSSGTVNNL